MSVKNIIGCILFSAILVIPLIASIVNAIEEDGAGELAKLIGVVALFLGLLCLAVWCMTT